MSARVNSTESNAEISLGIEMGVYELISRTRKRSRFLMKSNVWSTWRSIVHSTNKSKILEGKIGCSNCNEVRDYSTATGTTGLERHIGKCFGRLSSKSISSLPANEGRSIKKMVEKQVVEFLCKDLRSFRSIECEGFVALANTFIKIGHLHGILEAKETLPPANHLKEIISTYAVEARQELRKEKLESIESDCLAITCDLWTEDKSQKIKSSKTKRSFINVNCHFLCDGQLLQNILFCKAVAHRQNTGENIQSEVENILSEFSINANNVTFVSDRGSNIVKALEKYRNLHCTAHLIHNVVTSMLTRMPPDNSINVLLESCRTLIRYVKQSGLQGYYQLGLKKDNATRWNSTLRMLQSLRDCRSKTILQEMLKDTDQLGMMDAINFEILNKLIAFLEVFEEVSVQCQQDKKVSGA